MGVRSGGVALALGCLVLSACREASLDRVRAGLVASPSSLDFGSSPVRASQTRWLTLRNEGRAVVDLRALSATEPSVEVPDFAPVSLRPGEQVAFEARFVPAALGEVSGALRLESDADDGEVRFEGKGVSGLALLDGRALDFGGVPLFTEVRQELWLENQGDAPLHPQVAIEGADAFAVTDAPLPLGPGERRAVPIRFRPGREQPFEATARVTPCAGCTETLPLELRGTGVEGGVVFEPWSVDFGAVAIGARASRSVRVSNPGSAAVALEAIGWREDSAIFAVDPVPLGSLAPGASLELHVSFSPRAQEVLAPAWLTLQVRRPGHPRPDLVVLPVKGSVDAACVVASPRALDFGLVPLGERSPARLELVNRCGGPAEVGQLTLEGPGAVDFSLERPTAAVKLQAGERLPVEVTFHPAAGDAEGARDATLSFEVREGGAPAKGSVPLRASAGRLAPCVLDVQPKVLDFGAVPPGSSLSLGVGLRNAGSAPCFLASIGLGPGADPSFVAERAAGRLLQPGDRTLYPVRLRPSRAGPLQGAVELVLLGGVREQVPLRGEGAAACLRFDPPAVDFGTAPLTCGARRQQVRVRNACAGRVTLTPPRLGAATSLELGLAPGPALPSTLEPGGESTFAVEYRPVDEGPDLAAVWLETSAGRQVLAVRGRGLRGATQRDRFLQAGQDRVDLLFVIDNSGSMQEEQQSLSQNFAALLSEARAAGVDFHLGVTTTGLEPSPSGWSTCPGGVQGGENGRLFPVDGSSPRVLTPDTPDAAKAFATNVQVGHCHWKEEGLEAARRALTSNPGFLRADARLALVFVSDEEDDSAGTPAEYLETFRALKGGDPALLSVSAIVGPPDLATCATAGSAGKRYLSLAAATGGTSESICTESWSGSLRRLSSSAFGPRRSFPLSQPPADPSSLEVQVNGVAVRAGWSYDPATRNIVFQPASVPGPGAEIVLAYTLGC